MSCDNILKYLFPRGRPRQVYPLVRLLEMMPDRLGNFTIPQYMVIVLFHVKTNRTVSIGCEAPLYLYNVGHYSIVEG